MTIITHRNWKQRSLVFLFSKIDLDHQHFGGGEHGQMRRDALNNDELPFDAMITNNNDWKLVVLIVVNFFKSQNIYYD